MKKKQKNNDSSTEQTPKSNPIIASIVNLVVQLLKHVISDTDFSRSGKKNDQISDRLESMNNMLRDMHNKIDQCSQEIERLKNRILWGYIIFIVVLASVLFQLVLVR